VAESGKDSAVFFWSLDVVAGLRRSRKPAFHGARINQASLLELKITPGKHSEVGNSLHTEASGELRELFGVNLEHDSLAGEVSRYLSDVRSGHAAGSAPRGPEIHYHWCLGIQNLAPKFCRRDVKQICMLCHLCSHFQKLRCVAVASVIIVANNFLCKSTI